MRYTLADERRGKFLVRTVTVTVPGLPAELRGYRMAQLTDFHIGPATSVEHLRSAFAILKELAPRVLFLTGDYVQYTRFGFNHVLGTRVHPKVFGWTHYRRMVRALAEQLGELLAKNIPPDGAFGVFGNHDHLEGLGSIVRKMPEKVTWLTNDWARLRVGAHELLVAGVDDMNRGKPDLRETFADLAAPEERSGFAYRILLSHNPDIVLHRDAALLERVDLVLSGHTHGGQIRLPLWGPILTRTRQKRHVQGLSYEGNTALYINSGIGYGAIGVRILCPPEITIFELEGESA